MQENEASFWLQQGEERLRVFLGLVQPMTADQLARRVEKVRSSVSDHIRQMRVYQLVKCLNPAAHQSRVYWFTESGHELRVHLGAQSSSPMSPSFPLANWDTYGCVCFRHRRAVLLAMRDKMRPPQVKRRALSLDAGLRMSVDNCREVLYWMRDRCLVRAVRVRKKRFVFYELTMEGKACQQLLQGAESRTAA